MKILADVSHPKFFDKKNSTTFPLNCAQCLICREGAKTLKKFPLIFYSLSALAAKNTAFIVL